MTIGDIRGAYEKRLQLGDHQSWPCPRGHWEGEPRKSRFVIVDGRHEYLAAVALGVDRLQRLPKSGQPIAEGGEDDED